MFSVLDGGSLLSGLFWFDDSPVFYGSISLFLSSVLLPVVKGLTPPSLSGNVSLVFSPLKVSEDSRFYSQANNSSSIRFLSSLLVGYKSST
jgi:hypothetical protein